MTKQATEAKKPKGQHLAPAPSTKESALSKRMVFWVGMRPGTTVDFVTIGGVSFPRVTASLVSTPSRPDRKQHRSEIGSLVRMSKSQLDILLKKIPQTVIRFTESEEAHAARKQEAREQAAHDGLDPDAVAEGVGRKGFALTIPTESEVEAHNKVGRSMPPYEAQKWDSPIAEHIYAVPCKDQKHPGRGNLIPDPVLETGLEWPE